MKIPFIQSVQVAQKLLKEINKRASKAVAKTYYAEAYSNGREHGFHLAGGDKVVSFSENRNSDDIVVYIGDKGSFSMQGNVPSEETWKNRKFFPPEAYKEAADYILLVLEEYAAKWMQELEEFKKTEERLEKSGAIVKLGGAR